jgi:outer membrane lipoprotein-sorting protein
MSKLFSAIALLALCLASALPCAADPDANALLRQSDAFRNGWPAFVVHVRITDYASGKSDEEHLYEVSQKGSNKTYVQFMSPREKGEHLLMLGDDMWIYLPDTSRPIRITPLERLTGDAANGDVARTNYAADYKAVYLRTEKQNGVECYLLDLTAKRKGSTYQRILYWLRVEDARPLRAEFYLTSGKRIKSATFDDYEMRNGKMLLHRLTLYDEIRRNSHSVLEYSSATPRTLPDKIFYQGREDRF